MPLLYLIHFLMVVHKIHRTKLHYVPRVLTVWFSEIENLNMNFADQSIWEQLNRSFNQVAV